jgi:hypothetical protein
MGSAGIGISSPAPVSKLDAKANLDTDGLHKASEYRLATDSTPGAMPALPDKRLLFGGVSAPASSASLIFDATNKTLAVGDATAGNSTLALLLTRTLAAPVAGTMWRGLDVQTSTLTLAAGGTVPDKLAMVRFSAPVITAGAGSAYTVPIAATVTIEGPPTASAAGGSTPTLAKTYALRIEAGGVAINPLTVNCQSITLYSSAYGIGMDTSDTVIWGTMAYGVSIKSGNNGYDGYTIARFRNGNVVTTNYLDVLAGSTGNPVTLSALGADNDIGLALLTKGTGKVKIPSLAGTGSRTVVADANGILSAP